MHLKHMHDGQYKMQTDTKTVTSSIHVLYNSAAYQLHVSHIYFELYLLHPFKVNSTFDNLFLFV